MRTFLILFVCFLLSFPIYPSARTDKAADLVKKLTSTSPDLSFLYSPDMEFYFRIEDFDKLDGHILWTEITYWRHYVNGRHKMLVTETKYRVRISDLAYPVLNKPAVDRDFGKATKGDLGRITIRCHTESCIRYKEKSLSSHSGTDPGYDYSFDNFRHFSELIKENVGTRRRTNWVFSEYPDQAKIASALSTVIQAGGGVKIADDLGVSDEEIIGIFSEVLKKDDWDYRKSFPYDNSLLCRKGVDGSQWCQICYYTLNWHRAHIQFDARLVEFQVIRHVERGRHAVRIGRRYNLEHISDDRIRSGYIPKDLFNKWFSELKEQGVRFCEKFE